MIDGQSIGHVSSALYDCLKGRQEFLFTNDTLFLSDRFHGDAERTQALQRAAHHLLNIFPDKKLRQELYPVKKRYDDPPLALIDRVAVPWFGLRAWGVHINGFVCKPDGLYLWVGERAADRMVAPGKLDHLIAGGQPHGVSLAENIRKEAYEEAGMAADLADRAVPVTTLSYQFQHHDGIRNDTIFVYDLELPQDFVPHNTDGEVAAFHLLPVPEVIHLIRETDRFKFNVNLVIIDFMLRHSLLKTNDEVVVLQKAMIPLRHTDA